MGFAMSSEDLTELKKIVDRAEEKQNTLSRTLERANLPEFDVTGDVDG
jgi:hypothetical protein